MVEEKLTMGFLQIDLVCSQYLEAGQKFGRGRENKKMKQLKTDIFQQLSAYAAHRTHCDSSPRTKTQDKTVRHTGKSYPPFPHRQ